MNLFRKANKGGGGTTIIEETLDLEHLNSPNGYVIFPNGFCIQWGSFVNNVSARQWVNFPREFTQVYTVVVDGYNRNATNFTTTQFGYDTNPAQTSQNRRWFAIGLIVDAGE